MPVLPQEELVEAFDQTTQPKGLFPDEETIANSAAHPRSGLSAGGATSADAGNGRPAKAARREPAPNAAAVAQQPGETELARQMWERGELKIDEVCGVTRPGSEKARSHDAHLEPCSDLTPRFAPQPCVRPLDCKYHSAQQKRDVLGRSQSFDALVRAFTQQKRTPNAARPGHGQQLASKPAALAASPRAAAPGSPAAADADGASPKLRLPVVIEPDPVWQSEWAQLLEKMPPMQDARAAAARGDETAWPRPICVQAPRVPASFLWGVPVAEVAPPPDEAGKAEPPTAGGEAAKAETEATVKAEPAAEGKA
jgi:hypothetical protein